jgi:hypothetical protein
MVSRKKILLVDDSSTALMIEKTYLGRGPYDGIARCPITA